MPQQPEIAVVTVSWNSAADLRHLIGNLIAKSAFPELIKFIIIDNTNGFDQSLKDLQKSHSRISIIPNEANFPIGSQNHASGLNASLVHVKTPYVLITDPDVYVFQQDWDVYLIALLERNQTLGAGTVYPPWQLGKYHDFPSPVFSFYKTDQLMSIAPDWMCYNESAFHRAINIVLLLILRCGYLMTRERYIRISYFAGILRFMERSLPVCSCETGWQLACRAREKRVKTELFEVVFADRINFETMDHLNNRAIKAVSKLADNFELYTLGGKLFLTHRYSSNAKLWKTSQGHDKTLWKELIHTVDGGL